MAGTTFELRGKRVWVAGHGGMVGSALLRRLHSEECEIVTAPREEVDLRDPATTRDWLDAARPDVAFLAAAKVGGILANDSCPADFLHDNLAIEMNVIDGAFRSGVQKLLFLGSSCIYPRLAPQPIPETALMTGPLEPTNEWYAIAKIAGISLCRSYRRQHGCDFISAMPTNLYGPRDNFDPHASHALPALLRKAHEARCSGGESFEVWGSGYPRREFLYVDDCADALVFMMKHYSDDMHVNVGVGADIAIADLAEMIARVVGYSGGIRFDPTKPDGTPRKLLDVSCLQQLGWTASTPLDVGLRHTYRWFLDNVAETVHAAPA
jgi:GDP-L-fucose synthase